jgi:hypothetical protein
MSVEQDRGDVAALPARQARLLSHGLERALWGAFGPKAGVELNVG